MATYAEKIDQLMGRLGQRKSQTLQNQLIVELNSAIAEKENGSFLPWFLEKTTTLDVTTNDTYVSLPTSFIREREESVPYYVLEGKTYYLEKRLFGALPGYDPLRTSPEVYAISGGRLHFRPAADRAYTFNLTYYGHSASDIAYNQNPITNPWWLNGVAFEYVTAAALKNVATLHLQNTELGGIFASLESKYRKELYVFHESRIHENQDYYVGGASGT